MFNKTFKDKLLALNKWPDLSYVDSKKYIKVYPLTDNSMMNKYKIKKLYEDNEDVTVRVLIRSHVCDFNTALGLVPELDVTLLPPLDVDQIYNIKNMVLKVLDYVEPVPYANVAGTGEYAEAVSKELKKFCEDYVSSGSYDLEYKSKYLAVKIKVSKRVDLDSTVEMLRNL